jgi:hypothetical protein
MVDQVFIPQRNPEHALADQRRQIIFDMRGQPPIREARRETAHQANRPVHRPQ